MEVTNISPVYKLKDERFFLALCKHNMDNSCFDIYFINNSAEEIKSLRMRIVEYCYKANLKESEQVSFVEERFYAIPAGGNVVMTAMNIADNKQGEYISSFEIMTDSEKVIAECTMYKDGILSSGFDKSIPSIGKEGKKISLESRTFSK